MCDDCGMIYTQGKASEETAHEQFHKTTESTGIDFPVRTFILSALSHR